LTFLEPPICYQNNYLGIVDASIFSNYIDKDELFSFNIRKFLGMRKNSVGFQIYKYLEDQDKYKLFWLYNNGIVCLCTRVSDIAEDKKKIKFENFTIVNGAQTVNIISKYKEKNPSCTDPIWVVAKISQVEPSDINYAIELTKTSNSQNQTSNIDIRSVDPSQRIIKDWLKRDYNIYYQYKRGDKAPPGSITYSMKEIAQSYVAFHRKEPHIAFGYVKKIFTEDQYYSEIFPFEKIEELKESGSEEKRKEFLIDRLIPVKIYEQIKKYLKDRSNSGELDKKYRSLAYHILWIYGKLLTDNFTFYESNRKIIIEKCNQLVDETIEDIVIQLKEECETFLPNGISNEVQPMISIPKDLKTDIAAKKLENNVRFFNRDRIKKSREKINNLIK
jgi:hypothetical protein